jgi:hypothetical protein
LPLGFGCGAPSHQLMAARRLLIVMLVLLGISTLAAALIPQESMREGTTTGNTTTQPPDTATTTATPPPGTHVQVAITVGGDKVPVVACPERDRRKESCQPIRIGDALTLRIYSRETAEVEIPAFGLVGVASPAAPALFELLFRSAARYGVRFTSSGKIAARIIVLPAKGKPKPR